MAAILFSAELASAFTMPALVPPCPSVAQVRFTSPLMKASKTTKSSKSSKAAPEDTITIDTTEMAGVVTPTGSAVAEESPTPVSAPAPAPAPTPPPPKPLLKAVWNPQGLGVPALPKEAELFSKQFVPEYLKFGPTYLDGSMPGDIGFDPWGLTVLAKPTLSVDALQALDKSSRTAEERNARMLALSPEEQQANLLWMRSSELKHGRLAMLAVAGWPMAELINGGFLRDGYTNGRAPSLFNGHLPDYLPFLTVFFGGLVAVELMTKDTVKDGDYNFDPLGFASGIGAMRTLQTAEVKHGRAAMMAITGFAVQECIYGTPVVEQTPFFFLPLGGFTG